MTTLNTIIEEEVNAYRCDCEDQSCHVMNITVDEFTTAMQHAYEAGEREAGSKIRDAYIKRISNHTGEFLNPWIPKTNLSHEELAHILNRLIEHLDTLLSKIRS